MHEQQLMEASMEQTEVAGTPATTSNGHTVAPVAGGSPRTALTPQMASGTCHCGSPGGQCSCGTAGPAPNGTAYVYAVGQVGPRFACLSAEKEYAQATGRAATAGLSDRQALRTVLSQRQNRYLLRQLCWVFTIQGLDTYILQPRDS